MNCPVCDSELIVFYSLIPSEDVGNYVEATANCPICDYMELNKINNKAVAFNDNYWEWNKDTPLRELNEIQAQIFLKLSAAKSCFSDNRDWYYPVD